MELNKITLPAAYMIETLRSKGITNEQLLTQINNRDISPWKNVSEHFDFNELIKLADQDQNAFKSIVLQGYSIKFVTIRGLQNLLRLKFDIVEDRDYLVTDKGISELQIENSQLAVLKQMLSKNCTIFEMKSAEQHKKIVRIELS
ncbi:hypothetical protein [Bacillus niameyensis]|uniref:hypothetical protein n=1 Tax=Bacillus niameyensis TaxID=1522308 RepID=UPI00078408A8|nr:hypothetical protein [Bacillus niameyensis]